MEASGTHDRSALGAADVDDACLREMVAAQLARPVEEVHVLTSTVEPVAYDLDAITTASRSWVRGEALVEGARVPYSFFVKVVQSFSRSPFFAMVPPDQRDTAAATVPWRTEPLVYRSDLRDRLPAGLTMPLAYGTFDLDEASASVWLEEIRPTHQPWDLDRFAAAAHLLGRLSACPRVTELARVGGHDWTVHDYLEGRLRHQVLPMLRDDDVWRHPLVAGSFDRELRDRLRALADSTASLVDELVSLPTATGHGDACPNNLLARPDGGDGFVLIDFGFWHELPIAFDLGQLVVGDIQIGRRSATGVAETDAAVLTAYLGGLRAEGLTVAEDVVRRAHALQLVVFTGLSTLPFEHLGDEPTPALHALGDERAAIARFTLDLLDATARA